MPATSVWFVPSVRSNDRLGQLSVHLGDADWLDGAFSAGDVLMVSVLLRSRSAGILDEYPNLARGESAARLRASLRRSIGGQRAIDRLTAGGSHPVR